MNPEKIDINTQALEKNSRACRDLEATLQDFISVIKPEFKKSETINRLQEEKDQLLKEAKRFLGDEN